MSCHWPGSQVEDQPQTLSGVFLGVCRLFNMHIPLDLPTSTFVPYKPFSTQSDHSNPWDLSSKLRPVPSFPRPSWCVRLTIPLQVFSQDFRIKWFLAKKQRQNHLIPQWIGKKTCNKISYNSRRRQWRRTKLGLQGSTREMAHTFMRPKVRAPILLLWELHYYPNNR